MNTMPNIAPVFALFKAALPSDGTTSDLTPSCIAFNDDSLIGSGNRLNRINKIRILIFLLCILYLGI